MNARVVLAMSGGVDSSVAAYLLQQQGYDVIGLFMRTGVHQPVADYGPAHKKGCCSALDAGDARRVADSLDIPFYALDFEEDFGRIMDYFVDEYLVGRTPNPCAVCNSWLKFGKLWDYGRQLDADFIATGHYARMVNQRAVHRGADPAKDQSYVLFGVPRSILPRLLFPIGGYPKEEVRRLARELGLGVADKPDSVEICFVPNNDHADFIRRRRPELQTAGNFVDAAGNVLADHDGYERFTIGQRKGLGYAAGSRRYVLDIIPETHAVVLGDPEALLGTELTASQVNWLIDPPDTTLRCTAKIRYRHAPAAATLHTLPQDRVNVVFDQPQSAITPGQAVVFYDGDHLLGGGWIEKNVQG
ncbi:MAG: tRNA 2-thiouridine(34) synthase MnmA [Planctomycetes bacterium]|nr:tRNA 2-thiouridine(34) synthase MnmA [Planctomycetota bacterium]